MKYANFLKKKANEFCELLSAYFVVFYEIDLWNFKVTEIMSKRLM